jgi:hypothetical protein
MNLKLIVAISVLVTTPAFAQGQMGDASPKGPKPTTADVQKVVESISGDQAKAKLYCDLTKLSDQVVEAEEKNDAKKVEDLNKQIEASEPKLGVEYMNLLERLQQIDPSSKEGLELYAALQPLYKLCSKD